MKNNKKIFYTLLCLLFIKISYASEISIDASLDKNEVEISEELTLTVIISGRVRSLPEPQIPSLREFSIYSAGRSQSISIVNGNVTASITYNYILVPQKEGNYTLVPITLDFKGTRYKTQTFNIIVNSPKSNANSHSKGVPQQDNISDNRAVTPDVFIENKIDKRNAYVNEQITLVFSFYQAVNLAETPEYTPSTTTGFWVEELPPQKTYYKVIGSKRYLVTEIYTAIFPTASGDYTIGSAELICVPEQRFNDPFAYFYNRENKRVRLKTNPIKIHVKPIPEKGILSDFRGAVGTYTLEANIDKTNTRENEPVTLKIKIHGTGHIKTVQDLELPQEMENYFKKFKSNTSINITKKDYRVEGERAFEFILVPIKTGSITIPTIKFVYFSPQVEKYITAETPSFKLDIAPALMKEDNEDKNIPLSMLMPKDEIKRLGKDISYIKLYPQEVTDYKGHLYQKTIFLTIHFIPLLILFGTLGFKKYNNRLNNDTSFARSKKAYKLAQDKLVQARKCLNEDKSREFHSELAKAMQDYLGNKLNLPSASINQEIIKNELFKKEINNPVISDLINCMEQFDMARFAPVVSNKKEMEELLKKIENIIIDIEKRC